MRAKEWDSKADKEFRYEWSYIWARFIKYTVVASVAPVLFVFILKFFSLSVSTPITFPDIATTSNNISGTKSFDETPPQKNFKMNTNSTGATEATTVYFINLAQI